MKFKYFKNYKKFKLFKNENLKVFFIFFVIIFSILKFFNTPYNIYSIINWNYGERMTQNYGYCEKESWGFYNDIVDKYKLKGEEIHIINFAGSVTLENLFEIQNSKKKDVKYFILLNLITNEDYKIYKDIILDNYNEVYKYDNCYLLKKI